MSMEDALQDIIRRLGSADGGGIISWSDAQRWPKGALEVFQKAVLIKPTAPAQSVECHGCEDNCFMPVHVFPSEHGRPARAFVACDQRDDMGRVRISEDQLKQWKTTGMQAARWLSEAIGTRGILEEDSKTGRIRLGALRDGGRAGDVFLAFGEKTELCISGKSLSLTDVVCFRDGEIEVDRALIVAYLNPDPTGKREAGKLKTATKHKEWNRAYKKMKSENPNKSDTQIAEKIAKLPIGKKHSPSTIRKNMKKK